MSRPAASLKALALSVLITLSVLSAVPAHAQLPSLGDLGGLFQKSKSKPIPISVNGQSVGNALQDHGTVYVPLSVLQATPHVAVGFDAVASRVTITTAAAPSTDTAVTPTMAGASPATLPIPDLNTLPSLNDLKNLFKKSKSKPLTVSVNGQPAGSALLDHGTVYVPLSVFQSLPNMTAAYDTGTSSVGITSSVGTLPAIAGAVSPTNPTAAQNIDPASPQFFPGTYVETATSDRTPVPNPNLINSPGIALVPGSIKFTALEKSTPNGAVTYPNSLMLTGIVKDTSDVGELQTASVIVEFYDADGKSLGIASNTKKVSYREGMSPVPGGTDRESMFSLTAPDRCRSYKILAVYDHFTFRDYPSRVDSNVVLGGKGFDPARWKLVSHVKAADGSLHFEGGNQIAIWHDDYSNLAPADLVNLTRRNLVGFTVHCSPLGTISADGQYLMSHGKALWDRPVEWGSSAYSFSFRGVVFEATALASKQNWTVTFPTNTDYKLVQIYTRDTPLASPSSSLLPPDRLGDPAAAGH